MSRRKLTFRLIKTPFLVLLIILTGFGSAYGQFLYKIKQDCLGAYSKEDLDLLTGMLVNRDKNAVLRMILEGRACFLQKGERVYLENTSFWTGTVEIRPEGSTHTIWLPYEYIVEDTGDSPSENYQPENRDSYKSDASNTYGDIKIYLKNGNSLRGKIKKRTKEGVWFKVSNGKGEIFVRNSEIEKIEKNE